MGQGYSKEAFAGKIGVAKQTIYNWMDQHPEFLDSVKKAEEQCRLFWEGLGIEMVMAGQGNPTAWIFNMKNRFYEEWRDRKETDITSGGKPLPILNGHAVQRDDSNEETT